MEHHRAEVAVRDGAVKNGDRQFEYHGNGRAFLMGCGVWEREWRLSAEAKLIMCNVVRIGGRLIVKNVD